MTYGKQYEDNIKTPLNPFMNRLEHNLCRLITRVGERADHIYHISNEVTDKVNRGNY